ncbi:hypothetical protein [uncultured Thiodictyon sp.]|uniref:hypothetical protein n=1 Tax=uncultured Thiodictyon sp. TaxID=1846217 RepID=UPI0025D1E82C|nr:hypothetical protein [uncultured Thiodictyon sp.]
MNAFFDLLFSDDRGVCLACNILDSLQEGLFPLDRFRRLMESVRSELERDRSNVRTTTDLTGLISRVASGFSAAQPEKHLMVATISSPVPGQRLAHALKSETLTRWVGHMANPDLIPEPVPPRSDPGLDAYQRTIQAINDAIAQDPSQVFAADANIGYEVPAQCLVSHVWFTREDVLVEHLASGDDLRDVLGLETPLEKYQMLAVFDDTEPNRCGVARPTFADGGNSRFRVKPDQATSTDWGTTVHLGKLQNGSPEIDGAPERIAAMMSLRALNLEFRPVGWVLYPRDTSSRASHADFAERLLRGRERGTVRSAIAGFLI